MSDDPMLDNNVAVESSQDNNDSGMLDLIPDMSDVREAISDAQQAGSDLISDAAQGALDLIPDMPDISISDIGNENTDNSNSDNDTELENNNEPEIDGNDNTIDIDNNNNIFDVHSNQIVIINVDNCN